MKKMVVKNWKRIAAVVLAVIMVVGSVNLSGLSASAEGNNNSSNSVGGKNIDDFSLYQFLTYYQYVIKENANIGNHTVGSVLIGGSGSIGDFGEGSIAPVYVNNLQGSGNYAERYGELGQYYSGKVPAYYGVGSFANPDGWIAWDSGVSGAFIDFTNAFAKIQAESNVIAQQNASVTVDYNGSSFAISGTDSSAVTVREDSIQGKWGNLLTIEFSKFTGNKNITITEAAYQKLDVIDIRVNNIDDFNKPHNISILGNSVNVSYAYNPAMGTHPVADSAVCVTINGATFQGGTLKSMTGNKVGGQLLDAPMELLWNFPEAETATVEYLGGHVVAPQAALTIYGGNFEGGVIAESVNNQSAEGHMYPYYGIPKSFGATPPVQPILPGDTENETHVTVPINIEKTFGNSDFSDGNERSDILGQTDFGVYKMNGGYITTIQYNASTDSKDAMNPMAKEADYSGNFTFRAEKGKTYYFYLVELTTDTDRYELCKSYWAIKVEVGSDGKATITYASAENLPNTEAERSTTFAGLSYAEKDWASGERLTFLNEKKEAASGTVNVTIGLNKTYDGLTLTSLGTNDKICDFLNGTKFELTELNEAGNSIANSVTLSPVWNESAAVVSQEITITEGTTRYYTISEKTSSDGFTKSDDVYTCRISCDNAGKVTIEYKVNVGAYQKYSAGSYPTVTNARKPYSGTISLIKTYNGLNLATMNDTERGTLLNGTSFALYDSATATTPLQNQKDIHPVWKNGQAVVTFNLSNVTITSGGAITYYIKETQAPSGYVASNVVYECKISNVNGRYEVSYRAGSSGSYTSAITCNNVNIAPVTLVISKTFDNISEITDQQMSQLITDTKFTFYDDAAMTAADITNDFKLQLNNNPVNNGGGNVSYTYEYKGTLQPGTTYTYYVEETDTNQDVFNLDGTVYKIVIEVGQPTGSDASVTITPNVTYTKVSDNTSVDALRFTNTRIPKPVSPVTISFTKVFENNFRNVPDGNTEIINRIISDTRFTLYSDKDCTNAVTGFTPQPTNRNDENVTYEYHLQTSFLEVDHTYYYYLKETNTNTNYYQLDGKTYVVKIDINGDGASTVTYAEYSTGSDVTSATYTSALTITNTQKQNSSGSPTALVSPEITFNKVFDSFAGFMDEERSEIITATTFSLTSVDGAKPIGFVRRSPAPTATGATYSYKLDVDGWTVDDYTGGTYLIKETATDSRYTRSDETLQITVTVNHDSGELSVSFKNGVDTITNDLKPTPSADNSSDNGNTQTPNPGTPDTPSNPTTPNTPSTPDTPATPSAPATPSNPTTPDTPNAPTLPDTPISWETPDGGVGFEILIEYENVDSSTTPEKIDELLTNTTIKITDQNGNDVTENVTKITWDPSRNVAIVKVELPKPSEGFDTYYVVESTDPADNDLSHSEPGKGFTVAITSDGDVLFQEDGSASATTELRFVNVESATDGRTLTMTSMTAAQTGERKLPWVVFGGGMTMVFIAGVVYVFRKKEKIEE